MDGEKFIKLIKRYTRELCIESSMYDMVIEPKNATNIQKQIYEFYKNLPKNEKLIIEEIVKTSVDNTIFGILCVIDGVNSIEDYDKGRFELIHINNKNNKRTLLNADKGYYLHEYYK